jgi:hypothetical protein
MSNSYRVCVLSVIFENHDVFKYNYHCIKTQNRSADITFVIVDNSEAVDHNFISQFENDPSVHYLRNGSKPSYQIKRNSFHHALGLDCGIKYALENNLYFEKIIVIDPDYFLIGDDWLFRFSKSMDASASDFLGSPWGARWRNKYRNFPCVQFMMIDRKVLKTLPTFAPIDSNKKLRFFLWRVAYSNRYLAHLLGKLFDHSVDTGSVIFERFKSSRALVMRELGAGAIEGRKIRDVTRSFEQLRVNLRLASGSVEIFELEATIGLHFRSFGNLFKFVVI